MDKSDTQKMTPIKSWSCAPLAWGNFIWFISWGLRSSLISYYPLNYLIRVVTVFFTINLFF